MPKILKIAHRGASGYAPENTLAAFEKAVALGVDMIEFDVRMTRDRELVIFHDSRISRVTNGKGSLKRYTYQQLSQFHVQGFPIPKLSDALAVIGDKCQINIEIKQRGLADDIAAIVKNFNLHQKILISSFIHSELVRIRTVDRDLRVAVLLSSGASCRSAIKLAKKLEAEALNIPLNKCNPRFIRAVKNAGIKLNVWTIDEYEEISWLKELGIDGIYTNYPDRID